MRFYYKSPLGLLEVSIENNAVASILFCEPKISGKKSAGKNELAKKCVLQLDEYFFKKRKVFDLPLSPEGSEFQKTVWDELKKIPYGKTISYLELAKRLGNEKTIRAAASANGKNPHAIIVPCHRVIGSNGSLTGYAGGLWRKKWLLEHEGILKNKQLELFKNNIL